MFNYLKSFLFSATLLVAMSILTTDAHSTDLSKLGTQITESELTVTITSSTSVSLSWVGWTGSSNYTVSVLDKTTSQLVQQFTTSSTSTAVSGLTTGHNYRFSVEKDGFIIIEDDIVL
ncbi:MAG: fibronectin type III domain-containing protein [Saprospiraceae bacterium]|nr:fibronectin type III domain-containing protein [Saprospiraceae bacterium]